MAAWDDKQCSHVKRVVIIPRVCRCIIMQCEACGNDKLGGPLSDRAHVQHALCCHFVPGRNIYIVVVRRAI